MKFRTISFCWKGFDSSTSDSTITTDFTTTTDYTLTTDFITTNDSTITTDDTSTTDSTITTDSTTTPTPVTYIVFLTNLVKIAPILKNKASRISVCLDIDPDLVFQVATNTVSFYIFIFNCDI